MYTLCTYQFATINVCKCVGHAHCSVHTIRCASCVHTIIATINSGSDPFIRYVCDQYMTILNKLYKLHKEGRRCVEVFDIRFSLFMIFLDFIQRESAQSLLYGVYIAYLV